MSYTAGRKIDFDAKWIERIILYLGDTYNFQIVWVWDRHTALITGACAVASGVVGYYTHGKWGGVLGTGIGGAAGLGLSTLVPLRKIWSTVKDKLKDLSYIVFNYLRRLDAEDYKRAYELLMKCATRREELVIMIIDFIAKQLQKGVSSNIYTAHY